MLLGKSIEKQTFSKEKSCSLCLSQKQELCSLPTKSWLGLSSMQCVSMGYCRDYPVSLTWGKTSTHKILQGRYSFYTQQWQHAPLKSRPDVHLCISGWGLLLDTGVRCVSGALLNPWSSFKHLILWADSSNLMVFDLLLHANCFLQRPGN
jgi:hypothetical protein